MKKLNYLGPGPTVRSPLSVVKLPASGGPVTLEPAACLPLKKKPDDLVEILREFEPSTPLLVREQHELQMRMQILENLQGKARSDHLIQELVRQTVIKTHLEAELGKGNPPQQGSVKSQQRRRVCRK